MRPVIRRLARISLWTAGVVLTLVLLTGVVIETSFFKNWLRGVIVRQANQHINGTLTIGRFKGSLFSGVELEDVAVMMNGEPIVRIDALKTTYSIRELVSNGTTVDSVAVVRPVVKAHREGAGWQLARLVQPGKNQSKSTRRIAIRHITIIDGTVAIDKARGKQNVDVPDQIDKLNASLGLAYEPDKSTTLDVGGISFVAANPALELRQMAGRVTVTGDSINVSNFNVRTGETAMWADGAIAHYKKTPTLAMNVTFTPLSLPEIRRFVPSMKRMNVAPTISMKLGGPTTRLATEVSARSTAGNFAFRGTVSLGGPDRVYSGDVAVHHLDLAPFLNNPEQKSDIVVYAKIDVRGPAGFDTLRGSVSADAPLVSTHGYIVEGIRANAKIDGRKIAFDTSELAYRSNTTAAGTVEFASDQRPETRFDLRGAVKDVGLAYLPKQTRIPPAETKLSMGYHVRIVIPRKPGWHVDGEVQLAKSTVAGVTIGDRSKASFVFEPNVVQYKVDMSVLDVDLEKIGRQFNVQTLMNPRYQTSLNGHVVASVNGIALDTMDLTASGAMTDSSVFSGRIPELTFEWTIAKGDLHVKANGLVDKINPAIAFDIPTLEGEVSGNVDTDVTLHQLSKGVDENSIEGTLTADLGPSKAGEGAVDRLYVSGDYRNAFADIYQLDVSGSDIKATGHGTIAFNETEQSGFWIHADAAHLESINAALKSQQALTGIGTLDAVVGGNKKEYTINGTVTGNGIRYGEVGALAASTKFSAKLPNFDVQQTAVTADTSAAFVDIPGVQINELTAKTDYRDKTVDFTVNAKQPQRSLAADGSLILHPDHNEVHLTALDFQTQGMRWQTGKGHSPAIQWGGGTIDVKDFSLVNGSQEIRAEGAIGTSGSNLDVYLKDVDLGVIDVFLVRPQQLWGTVNAKAVVSGTTDALTADAEFTIANGRFRQVPFESITGKAKYTPTHVVVDTKLQQNESQWILAKGELPTSLFKGQRSDDRIDLHVDSSMVDLGIIQGLTTAVSGVQGKLQAKLDVTGTALEPRVEGGVTIAGGGFKVEETGVTYKGLDGKINFLPDRVHIDDLHVLDRDNDYLTVTGDLGVSGLRLSNVNLGFYADNFKVLGNEMGNLHVNSNIELTGTLANPKVVGDLGVTTGNIKLDPILAKLTNSAYSTSELDIAKIQGPESNQRQGLLGALELALHVTIPDDLVVKADDLKTDEGSVGLGKLNVTLGGDLNVAAAPGKPITLVGNVNTVRGVYDYQGRRFTVLRDGAVRFEGDPVNALDPALDVSAERMIQSVTVRVNVRGRLRRPDIELTSIPPQDQADILALIIFNQPLNQLGEGQQISLAQRAGSIAAGAVANQLTGSIANSLNLDEFEINLSPDTGGAAELTVGQQLGQNLYVKVQQGIGDNSQTNFVLEYEFAKWLRLQTNVLEGSTTQQQLFQKVKSTGADLVFSFQFK
jgi:autotransporter translocation and assembly factor TamB